MYEMKDEYLTGVEIIDKEHRKLFEIAEEIYVLLKNEFITDKYDKIAEVLGELKDYSLMHFKHEEEYMESINYKKQFSQKIAHEEFKKKIESYDLDDIDSNQDESIVEILNYVTDWLINHIMKADKLIGK